MLKKCAGTPKTDHKPAKVGRFMVTFSICHLWQLFPSVLFVRGHVLSLPLFLFVDCIKSGARLINVMLRPISQCMTHNMIICPICFHLGNYSDRI